MDRYHEHIIEYMHEYLDDEITEEHEKELRNHLQECSECRTYFQELRKTVALVQSTSHIQAPVGFTENVLKNLPKEKKKNEVKRWFGRHPIFVAAAVFFLLMTTSFLTSWNQNDQFSVTKNNDIVIENNTALIPEGKTVKGDVIVKNGDIRIEGTVEGNVTVINGERYMASAGKVTGEIEVINQAFGWLWHEIKGIGKEITDLFKDDTQTD